MSTRKTKKPELNKAIDSLGEAAQHVRLAVQGKVLDVREAASAELARAKALALKKTGVVQKKVDRVLKKAESQLHALIVKAQKALDKVVKQAEKQDEKQDEKQAENSSAAAAPAKRAATKPAAVKKTAAKKTAAKKAGKKAAAKKAAAQKAAPGRKARAG